MISKSINSFVAILLITNGAFTQTKAGMRRLENGSDGQVLTITRFGASSTASSSVNGAAINAALAQAAATGRAVHIPAGSYAVRNIVIPTGANIALIGEPGTIFRCETSDGSDCVAARSVSFSNPIYTFENLTLVGPDNRARNAAHHTTTSGNGIVISGSAVPLIRFKNITVSNFYGPGKAGVWLDNVENGTFADGYLHRNDIGLKLTSAANANSFSNLALSLNASYGLYCSDCQSDVFDNIAVQSNEKTGWYSEGLSVSVINGAHFENNNTSGSPDAYGMDIRAAPRLGSIGNVFNALVLQGGGENIHLQGEAGYAVAHNHFNAGITTSAAYPFIVLGGFAYANVFDQFAPLNSFKGARSEIESQIILNEPGTGRNLLADGSPSAPAISTQSSPSSGWYWSGGDYHLSMNGQSVLAIDGTGGLQPRYLVDTVGLISSAFSIVPSSRITHVTGSAAISTIVPPAGFTKSGYGGCIHLIPDAPFTTTTAGNIAHASTAIVGLMMTFCYDNATSKWYPSY